MRRTDPELLWGLRGGGGNFGVVTALEYDLHPVGPMVLGGPIFWPLDQAPQVLRFLREFAPRAPDELGHRDRRQPGAAHAVPAGGALRHAGVRAAGVLVRGPRTRARGLAPLRSVGTPLGDVVRPVPYRALQSLLDGSAAPGKHAYWRSHRLPGLSDPVIDTIVCARRVDHLAAVPAERLADRRRGRPGRPARPRSGLARYGFEFRLVADWRPDDPEPDRHRAWVAGWEALRPHSSGQFASFLSDEGPAGVRRPTAPGWTAWLHSRTATTRPTSSASTPTSRRARHSEQQWSKPMKILVTGATGNVGAPSRARARPRGVDTRAFVRDPEKARQRARDEVEMAVGDFADPAVDAGRCAASTGCSSPAATSPARSTWSARSSTRLGRPGSGGWSSSPVLSRPSTRC